MTEDVPTFAPARWWTLGLELDAGWIASPGAIEFLGDQFWLRPAADKSLPDISIGAPITGDPHDCYFRIKKFLSILSWFDGRRIIESVAVGSGGPRPVRVGNLEATNIRPHYTTDFSLRVELLPPVPNDDAWLGLALYREALGLNSVAYKVLGFLKIINIRYQKGSDQTAYMNSVLPFIRDHFAAQRLAQLQATQPDVGAYLYESCRCAVAHANTQPLVNPDNSLDTARLESDVHLIRAVAEHCIEFELGVKSHSTVLREHAYHVDGFRSVLTDAVISAVVGGISIPPSAIRMPNIDVRVRRNEQLTAFADMVTLCEELERGKVMLRLRSTAPAPDVIEIRIALDLSTNSLLFEPRADMLCAEPKAQAAAKAVVDFMEMQKQLLGNGIVEFYVAGSAQRLGRLDPYLPNNIDPRKSIENMTAIICRLRTQFNF